MKFILILCLLVSSAAVFAQRQINPKLAALRDEKDPVELNKKILLLRESNNEADLQILADYYGFMRDSTKSGQILELIEQKFPDGRAAFNKAFNEIYNETDGASNVIKYNAFVSRFGTKPEFQDNKEFHFAKTYVAFSFVDEQPKKVKEWIDKITDSLYRTKAYSYGARELADAKHYTEAEQLIKLSLVQKKSRGLKNKSDSVEYLEFARMAASILLAEKKYTEGYPISKMVYDDSKTPNPNIHKGLVKQVEQNYVNYLVGTKRYKEAFTSMSNSIKDGSATPLIKEHFKQAYVAARGNSIGYEPYYDSLMKELRDSTMKRVAKMMIKEPAFNFTVTDVNGKPVTLENLKGKVVILDFWATWCGPCIASFPRMQLAVNKYKNDPDVVFLFIHTWETGNDPSKTTESAVKLLASKKYNFKLAMDLKSKGAQDKTNPAATGFRLGGIPTKLIIDKEGNIRFKILGGGGSEGEDAFLGDMVAMIELSRESPKYSQNQNQKNAADTIRRYYSRLATSTNEADKTLLETKMYALLQSENEEDWNTAANFLYQLKKTKTVDSIRTAIKIKFPLGISVRGAATDTIYKQKDPVEKEKLYKAWIEKFPPEKFGSDRIQYDYVRNAVATAYAEAGNVKKAVEYANMTETGVWKGEGWAAPATRLLKAGYKNEALELFKKAVANSYKYMTTNRNDYGAQFAASGYIGYNNYVAEILIEQKKYAEALLYLRAAHDSSNNVRGNINSNYAKAYAALGKNQEAYKMIDEAVKAGQATAEMKEMLKELYVKVKGSNEGFDEYMVSVNKMVAEKIRQDLTRQMIKMPAPNFTLKDVDGNAVSLADYKGKTVLLDFWATWCGPCKKSFPAMSKALAKFKDDPNVKFLFIHTWEREDAKTSTDAAKKYVADNKLPFEVLMDLKDVDGLNKVVDSYKVDAIPTKFVVDKEGNIRFKFTGVAPGEEAAVEEVVAMIELARVKSSN